MLTRFRPHLTAFLITLSAITLQAGELQPVAAPGYGPMPGISSAVSIAMGSDSGFAVWKVGSRGIWGVPLTTSGHPAGAARQIADDPAEPLAPTIQSSGDGFEVWWSNYTAATKVMRIHPDGVVRETRTLPGRVSPAARNAEFTLAHANLPNDGWGVLVYDEHLEPVRSTPVGSLTGVRRVEAVTLHDGSFALIAENRDGLYLVSFTARGELVGTAVLVAGTTSAGFVRLNDAAITTDGESLLIVWIEENYPRPAELRSTVVEPGGAMAPVRTFDAGAGIPLTVDTEWAAGAYTVIFSAPSQSGNIDSYGLRLDRAGATIIAPTLVARRRPASTTMTISEGRPLLFFSGNGSIVLVRLTASGSIGRADPGAVDAWISHASAWQSGGAAAGDGDGWIAVWHEKQATLEEIRFAILDRDGVPAGPPWTLVSAPNFRGSANVVFNGVDYVVVWNQNGALNTQRITRDGGLLDSSPRIISETARAFSVAARDGVTFFAFDGGDAIDGRVLHSNGSMSDVVAISARPHAGSDGEIYYEEPIVSAGRETFLVAWHVFERLTMVPAWYRIGGEARLFERDATPRSATWTLPDTAGPHRSASTGGTHLLGLDARPRRAQIIDERTGVIVGGLDYGIGKQFNILAIDDGYAIARRETDGDPVSLDLYSAAGEARGVESTDAFTLPSATNPGGRLLAIGTIAVPTAPYLGATATVTQSVVRTPARSKRRRSVR